MPKLNFGSGRKVKEGWVNLDIGSFPGIDVVQDITKPPYPFPDAFFDYILCSHVLEHVPHQVARNGDLADGLITVMSELHRILKPGGTIEIRGPHPRIGIYYFNNITHYRVITQWTFDSLVGARAADSVSGITASRWGALSFSAMRWENTCFTDPPFGSSMLRRVMQKFPAVAKRIGRPEEIVVYLTK